MKLGFGFQKPIVIAVVLTAVLSLECAAQTSRFPYMSREGSACITLSQNTKTAYIVDGGHKGAAEQLRPEILLDQLYRDGYRNLVLLCSHPHADHAGGIKRLVRYAARNSNEFDLTSFENVFLIDSGYERGESLYKDFLSVHGEQENVHHLEATNANAFSEGKLATLNSETANAQLSNFVYQPKGEADIHGHSIITHTFLRSKEHASQTLLVDFDDAATHLVQMWADWAEAKLPDFRQRIYVLPHHGSDENDIERLLSDRLLPNAVVITVDPSNRYKHPGPENWLKWVQRIGAANVHLTGAAQDKENEAVEVTEKGVPSLTREECLAVQHRILGPLIQDVERDLQDLSDQWESREKLDLSELRRLRKRGGLTKQIEFASLVNADKSEVREWENSGEVPAHSSLAVQRVLHAAITTQKYQRILKRARELHAIENAYREAAQTSYERPQSLFVSANFRNPADPAGPSDPLGPTGPNRPEGGPSSPTRPSDPSPNDGGGTPLIVVDHSKGDRPNDPLATEIPRPTGPTGGGGLAFKELQQDFSEAIRDQRNLRRSSSPHARFSAASKLPPIFGGIIIGNEVLGPTDVLLRAEIASREEVRYGETTIVPEVHLLFDLAGKGQRSYIFDLATPTEVWCAYKYVNPPDNWHEQYGVAKNECNLLGISGHIEEEKGKGWTFGVHPALANTPLATHGMTIDMVVSATKKYGNANSEAKRALSDLGNSFDSYQWSDSPSRIRLSGSRVLVEAEAGTHEPLLRLRFWSEFSERDRKDHAELLDKFEDLRREANGDIDEFNEQANEQLDDRELRQLQKLLNNVDPNGYSNESTKKIVLALYKEVPSVQRIDRFARVVALFNYIKSQSSVDFPTLPNAIVPARVAVPPTLTYQQLAGRTSTLTHPIIAPTETNTLFWLIPIGLLVLVGSIFLLKKRKTNSTSDSAESAESTVLRCENCDQKLRVPTIQGEGTATCPKCNHKFDYSP